MTTQEIRFGLLRRSNEEFRTVEWMELQSGTGDGTDTSKLVTVEVPEGGTDGIEHV
jgi:hypothetical protein